MKSNALNVYKQTRVKTANQGNLIVMLYDEAIRQIDFAFSEMNKSKFKMDAVHNAIVKAQDIITELTVSLDFDKGGEVAKNLFSLYMFFNQQLVNANMMKDTKPLKEVRDLMNELRSAWVSIQNQASTMEPDQVSSGVNIAG